MERTPSPDTTTISPGFTSRTKAAPTLSNAQLSEANTTAPSAVFPMHSGRETLRIPGGDQLLRRHDHQGIRPRIRFMASSTASSMEPVRSLALVMA